MLRILQRGGQFRREEEGRLHKSRPLSATMDINGKIMKDSRSARGREAEEKGVNGSDCIYVYVLNKMADILLWSAVTACINDCFTSYIVCNHSSWPADNNSRIIRPIYIAPWLILSATIRYYHLEQYQIARPNPKSCPLITSAGNFRRHFLLTG